MPQEYGLRQTFTRCFDILVSSYFKTIGEGSPLKSIGRVF